MSNGTLKDFNYDEIPPGEHGWIFIGKETIHLDNEGGRVYVCFSMGYTKRYRLFKGKLIPRGRKGYDD